MLVNTRGLIRLLAFPKLHFFFIINISCPNLLVIRIRFIFFSCSVVNFYKKAEFSISLGSFIPSEDRKGISVLLPERHWAMESRDLRTVSTPGVPANCILGNSGGTLSVRTSHVDGESSEG